RGFWKQSTYAAQGPGIRAVRKYHHHFVPDVEVRIPHTNVCRRQKTSQQRALAITGDVLVKVFGWKEAARIKTSSREIRSPRSLLTCRHLARFSVRFEKQ